VVVGEGAGQKETAYESKYRSIIEEVISVSLKKEKLKHQVKTNALLATLRI